jgi:hypothetical protein
MQQPSDLVTVTQKRYRCRHVHAAGHQCGSPALRNEEFCYFHHTTRRPRPATGKFRHLDAHEPFELPIVEDLPSALSVAAQILCRVASNDLDHERAGKLLYNLQIITSIIDKASRAAAKAAPAPRPEPVEELVDDEVHGLIAPTAEYLPAEPAVILSEARSAQSKDPDAFRRASTTCTIPPPPPERDYTPEEQDYFNNTISPRGYEPYSQFLRPATITDGDIQIRADACRRARGFQPLKPCKDATGTLIVHELGIRYTTPLIALLAASKRPQATIIPTLNAAMERRPGRKMRSVLRIPRRQLGNQFGHRGMNAKQLHSTADWPKEWSCDLLKLLRFQNPREWIIARDVPDPTGCCPDDCPRTCCVLRPGDHRQNLRRPNGCDRCRCHDTELRRPQAAPQRRPTSRHASPSPKDRQSAW